MKNLLAITLIFFLSSELVLGSSNININNDEEKIKTSKSLRSTKKNNDKNSIKKTENVVENKIESNQDKKLVVGINSLGHEIKSDVPLIVDKFPYSLDRCDQTISYEAEYIPDLDDYTQRKKAYFTMTAHLLSRFETKDIGKLDQSIELESSRIPIYEPQGAQFCIFVDGGDHEKVLIFCGKDENEKEIFFNLLKTFKDCREGRAIGRGALNINDQKQSAGTPGLNDIQKSCGFDGPMPSPDVIIGAIDGAKEAQKEVDNGEFWIPGGHKVPGTLDDDEKKKKKSK